MGFLTAFFFSRAAPLSTCTREGIAFTMILPVNSVIEETQFIFYFSFVVKLYMHLHIPMTTTSASMEFESHKKIVRDIRSAVEEQKQVQKLIDLFMIGLFIAFLMYTAIF